MQCLNCGGQLEWAGGGKYARCMRDLSLFSQENGQLTPVVVQAPGGGFNPEFNNMFASNLGFGPPPPGAQPMPPPPNQDYGKGQFDLGGGAQLRVKINGQTPENYVKNQVSSMVWGWIIGAAIIGLLVIGGAIFGIYVYFQARDGASASGAPAGKPVSVTWDGKAPFTCGGNEVVTLTGVNATAGVVADMNCVVNLVNVNINAPVAITANMNSKVNVTGGSVTGTTHAAVANMNGIITFSGTKVTGKTQKQMNGKIIGAP
jgi:hypothetical protein